EESVLEVATDKVDTEIPSTHAGVLKDILVQKGEIVQVGAPIAILTVNAEAEADNNVERASPVTTEKVSSSRQSTAKELTPSHTNGKDYAADFKSSSKFFSPLVKNIAKQEKIT